MIMKNKIKNILKPTDRKTKFIAIVAGIGLLIHYVWMFWSLYTIQSPIVIELRSPVVSRFVSPIPEGIKVIPLQQEPTPTATPEARLVPKVEAAELAIDYDDVFEKVRILESGKGTAPEGHHVYCRNKDMWNEIGYGNRQGICFTDMQEGKQTLTNWYEKRVREGMTLAEALCYWESGHKDITNCTYAQRYYAL